MEDGSPTPDGNTPYGYHVQDYIIPYQTIRMKYDNQGILGFGFDWVLEIPSVTYLLLDVKQNSKIAMQHFKQLSGEMYTIKLQRIIEAANNSYASSLMKVICVAMQERRNDEKDLYVLYDYNDVITNLYNYCEEKQRSRTQFAEEEAYELIYTILDTYYIGGNNHMEYMDLNPFNIYLTQSDTQKFVLGDLGLTLPDRKRECEMSCPSDTIFAMKPLTRDASAIERAVIFKIGMVIMYCICDLDLIRFHEEFQKKISTQLIQKYITQYSANYSQMFISLLNDMLFINETFRPTIQTIVQTKADKYLPRAEKFYQGTIMGGKYTFKGWVEWYKDENDNLKKMMTGMGRIEGLFTGNFAQNIQYGYGVYYSSQGQDIWGDWSKDSIFKGIILNRAERYIFMGSFQNFSLSQGKGTMLFLRDNENDSGILAYEGDFVDGLLVSGECITLEGQYVGPFNQGQFHGKGKFTFRYPKKDVRIYEGEFFKGKLHGKGINKLITGDEEPVQYNMGALITKLGTGTGPTGGTGGGRTGYTPNDPYNNGIGSTTPNNYNPNGGTPGGGGGNYDPNDPYNNGGGGGGGYDPYGNPDNYGGGPNYGDGY